MPITITKQATKPQSASAKTIAGGKSTKCTGVQKLDKADPLFQTAQEVEPLSKEKAFALVEELIAEGGMNDFRLGGALAVIHDKCKAGDHEWLDGCKSFRDICGKRVKYHYRKAMYLIDIYKHLVEQQIPWEQVKHLGWSKLRVLAAKKVLTKKNAAAWVSKAEKLTVEELQNEVNGGEATGKTEPSTIKFKFDDQKETHKAVMAKAKDQLGTEVPEVAYHVLGQMWLGNAITAELKCPNCGNCVTITANDADA
jgi:hypothetical protein